MGAATVDYWANQIGTAAQALTAPGQEPDLGTAFDIGFSPLWNVDTFRAWARDQIQRSWQPVVQAAIQARNLPVAQPLADASAPIRPVPKSKKMQVTPQSLDALRKHLDSELAAQKAGGNFLQSSMFTGEMPALNIDGSAFQTYRVAGGTLPQSDFEALSGAEQQQALKDLQDKASPVDRAVGHTLGQVQRPLSAPLLAVRDTFSRGGSLGKFFEPSEWGTAWRESNTEGPASAIMDTIYATQRPGTLTPDDFANLQRNSNVYAVGQLGISLLGLKYSPSIALGKGLGEAIAIRRAALPTGYGRFGRATAQGALTVLRQPTLDEAKLYKASLSSSPGFRYGVWRAKRIIPNIETLQQRAGTMGDFEFAQLAPFQGLARNGPAAAQMMQIAFKHPGSPLADLTRRMVFGHDPSAFQDAMNLGQDLPADVRAFAPDAQTWFDGLSAMRGLDAKLTDEITAMEQQSLQDGVALTQRQQFFRPERDYALETYQRKQATLRDTLAKYDGYDEWLGMASGAGGSFPELENASLGAGLVHGLHQTLFTTSQFGKAHTLTTVLRAPFMEKATVADLERPASGMTTISRLADQTEHLTGFRDTEVLDKLTHRFVAAGDRQARYSLLRAFEDQYVLPAVARKFGLEPDVVRSFIREQQQMDVDYVNAVRRGNNSVFTTDPETGNTIWTVGADDHLHQVKMPAEIDDLIPLSPTQTPNYYMPIQLRQLVLAIKDEGTAPLFHHMNSEFQLAARELRSGAREQAVKWGSRLNGIWKPMQLLRFGWPARMFLDEGGRSFVQLGALEAMRQHGAAFGNAVADTLNPARFGLWRSRRNLPVGPGELIDQVDGRTWDPAQHALDESGAPLVDARFFGKPEAKRVAAIAQVQENQAMLRSQTIRHFTLMKEGLPAQTAIEADGSPLVARLRAVTDRALGKAPVMIHPGGLRVRRSGYSVPITEASFGKLDQLVPKALDLLNAHQDTLSRPGVFFEVEATGPGRYTVRVVRALPKDTDAATLAGHLRQPSFRNIGNGERHYLTGLDTSQMVEGLENGLRGARAVSADDPLLGDIAMTQPYGDAFYTTLPKSAVEDPLRAYGVRTLNLDAPVDPALVPDALRERASGAQTWGDLYGLLHADPHAVEALNAHLAQEGVAVLTHGLDREHQMYAWLDPHGTTVSPAYAPGQRMALSDWLLRPDARESLPLPEHRVHRMAQAPAEAPAVDYSHLASRKHPGFLSSLLTERGYGIGFNHFRTKGGKSIVAEDVFGPNGSPLVMSMIGSSPQYAKLGDFYSAALAWGRQKAVGYKSLPLPELDPAVVGRRGTEAHTKAVEYLQGWSNLVNNHMRFDPVWRRMMAGETDDQIHDWLATTRGHQYMRSIPGKSYDTFRLVEEHRAKLEQYLPSTRLQRYAAEHAVTGQNLLDLVPHQLLPNPIYVPDVDLTSGLKGLGKARNRFVEAMFHGFGAMPSDRLVRSPFARGMYQRYMRTQIGLLGKDEITNETLRQIQVQAREFAIRQVQRTMYSLLDDSNMTDALRFVSPFWGAQQEAMVKWARMFTDRPETLARWYKGWDLVYQHMNIVNQNGDRVPEAHGMLGYGPNDRLVLNVPGFMRKIPVVGEALKAVGTEAFPIGGINTALQGDQPLTPSMGPLITVPADKFLRAFMTDNGVSDSTQFWYKFLFPVGRPVGGASGVLEQMLPGWGRKAWQWQQGMNSPQYANTWRYTWDAAYNKHLTDGTPMPSLAEIQHQVNWNYAMQVVSRFVSPFTMSPGPPPRVQMAIQAYHDLLRTSPNPGVAQQKYLQKYGATFAPYLASSTGKGSVGVPPTVAGIKSWEAHRALIAQYPDWGSAMIDPSAWQGNFSEDVYNAETQLPVGFGRGEPLTKIADPEDAIAAANVTAGWFYYRQVANAVDAAMRRRGLSDIRDKGASDLMAIKQQFVTQLAASNPAWAQAYETDSNDIYSKVAELQQWVKDPSFDNRPDIQGVRQYLIMRHAVAEDLDHRYLTGGSRDLQAGANADLLSVFDSYVNNLKNANPAFADFYNRYLQSDLLERGSGP